MGFQCQKPYLNSTFTYRNYPKLMTRLKLIDNLADKNYPLD